MLYRSNGIQSSSGISSATSTPEEQEAKLKAEKIKLAIEKIKEANIKKIFIKVFTSDGSAKSLLVDEKMSVSHVTRILAEKNHVKLGKQKFDITTIIITDFYLVLGIFWKIRAKPSAKIFERGTISGRLWIFFFCEIKHHPPKINYIYTNVQFYIYIFQILAGLWLSLSLISIWSEFMKTTKI